MSQESGNGFLQRVSAMLISRCSCFKSAAHDPAHDPDIENRVAAINKRIRDAVQQSEPLTNRTLTVMDVTGRSRQHKSSQHKPKIVRLKLLAEAKGCQKGPVLSWQDVDTDEECQGIPNQLAAPWLASLHSSVGEVLDVQHLIDSNVDQSLTAELSTVRCSSVLRFTEACGFRSAYTSTMSAGGDKGGESGSNLTWK